MAPLDQVLWRIQRRAHHRATIVVIARLEGPVDSACLQAWHENLIALSPRFACRATGSARRPRWQPDPHFALDRHVVRVSLPAEADEAALEHLRPQDRPMAALLPRTTQGAPTRPLVQGDGPREKRSNPLGRRPPGHSVAGP